MISVAKTAGCGHSRVLLPRMDRAGETLVRGWHPLASYYHAPNDEQGNASDEGGHGLAPPGNRSEASNNNPAFLQEYETRLPFRERSCPVCLLTGGGNFMSLTLGEEIRHVREYHTSLQQIFVCSSCRKRYSNKHSAVTHVPKCPGPLSPAILETLVFECEACPMRFSTQVGLSQHQRHVHPILRNEARQRASQARVVSNSPQPQPRAYSSWTTEEIEIMFRLEVRFQGKPRIAKEMFGSGELPGRTLKQIRDKRNTTVYKRRLQVAWARVVAEVTANEGEDLARGLSNESVLPLFLDTADDVETDPQGECTTSVAIAHDNSEVVSDGVANRPLLCAPETNKTVDGNIELAVAARIVEDESRWRTEVVRDALSSPLDRLPSGVRNLVATLCARLEEAIADPPSQQIIDEIYEVVLSFFSAKIVPAQTPVIRQRSEGRRRARGRRARRQYEYARTQDLYRREPGLLAKYVRDGTQWTVEPEQHGPTVSAMEEFYRSIWDVETTINPPDMGSPDVSVPLERVLSVISPAEVERQIKKTSNKSAAGPDSITKRCISTRSDREIIRLLFNLVMVAGVQPTYWKKNRTTLIRKEGRDPARSDSYRPITIGSMLSRLYWGVLDKKLRSFSDRQKGFVSEAGCYNNVQILREVLKLSKERRGLTMVQLDVTAAFDTVPHQAIGPALRSRGLPDAVIRMVEESYSGVTTTAAHNGSHFEVPIRRGVKQGDPLSPFIFNAVLDPLLRSLEQMQGFAISGDCRVACLGFADDLVLLANSPAVAGLLLRRVEGYLGELGMKISAPKCTSFEIVPQSKSWYLRDPCMSLQTGEIIPYTDPGSSLKYLGMQVSPWDGITLAGMQNELKDCLERFAYV
uniref:Reverse transcriptase domain-containing protein n=1 Tax=Phlebotomus papatasi TaxID=29031 RepID=A0A1B0CZB4_PHLPP